MRLGGGGRLHGPGVGSNLPVTGFSCAPEMEEGICGRFNDLQVLKPALNTRPKVFYANLDGEVR